MDFRYVPAYRPLPASYRILDNPEIQNQPEAHALQPVLHPAEPQSETESNYPPDRNGLLVCGEETPYTVSYTHLDVYKRQDIDSALILVGKNNTGKTSVLDAICAVCGYYPVQESDFNEKLQAIRIEASISIDQEDLKLFHYMGIVSQYLSLIHI